MNSKLEKKPATKEYEKKTTSANLSMISHIEYN